MTIDLRERGWLAPLLGIHLELHDPVSSWEAIAELRATHPGAEPAVLATEMAKRRLRAVVTRLRRQASGPVMPTRSIRARAPS